MIFFHIFVRLKNLLLSFFIDITSSLLGTKASKFHGLCLRFLGVKINNSVFVGKNVLIFNPKLLYLGKRVAIPEFSHIACHETITIGDDFLAAPYLIINSGTHDKETMKGYGIPIKIGNRVWCGARVTICAGVEIGNDVIIGAGAVVVRSIESNSFAAGVPAKVISKIERDTSTFNFENI